ncbi:MAG: glycine cleavage system aminomethyltransferase GcvT [Candidatus Marinimicrobia bacterium]|nr:glycine cleavage system aminomethyltransferase GcvT [Candidatus Neomarinimicrobiota bacterium]
MKKTALYQKHIDLGARMAPFAGYEMPVQYEGISAEHRAVRTAVGLFDVSHMGEFRVSGPGALDYIQMMTINDATALSVGQAQYSAMCYENGGIVDDLLVYRRSDHYLLVVNAANIDGDFEWLQEHLGNGVQLENISDEIGLVAVQGPRSRELVNKALKVNVDELPFYHSSEEMLYNRPVLVSRTGYTGELGYELYTDPDTIQRLWDDLYEPGLSLGLKPAGLGARDTLRLEMKYCLYGNDISARTNPIEAGLGWITKLDKGAFIGSDAITKVKTDGPTRRLVAFEMEERAIPRPGYKIYLDGSVVGEVTSGTQSPSLQRGIGMGYVKRPHTKAGTAVQIEVRGKLANATIVKPPLVKTTSILT